MTLLNDAAWCGTIVWCLDFLVWRLIDKKYELLHLVIRALTFAFMTHVLFNSEMNPLRAAPWQAMPLRHVWAQALEVAWWLQAARLITAVLDRLVLPEAWHRERLFQDVLGAAIFLVAAVAAVTCVMEWSLRGLLATSGVLAVVLGLAIQSTLSDVFSGVVLNATQPFKLGDWVTIGDIEGKVVATNWRATHLLNNQGNIVVMPNSVAARSHILNANRPLHTHGVSVMFPVNPSIRPAIVLKALTHVTVSSSNVLKEPKPFVRVHRATNEAFEYEIVCYVDELAKKNEIRNEIFDLAHVHLRAFGVGPPPISPVATKFDVVDEALRLLRDIVIFKALNEDEINELRSRLTQHEFNQGQTIYNAAEAGSGALHILVQGVAKVSAPHDEGEVELRRLVPGDFIGQSSILAGVTSDVMVRALTQVTTFRLEKADLTPILARRPVVAKEMCRLLSEHHATEQTLLSAAQKAETVSNGFLQWVRDGMRRFHDIAL